MKMNIFKCIVAALIFSVAMISCTKDNTPEVLVPAGNVNTVELTSSVYDNQIFYDLSSNKVVATNAITAWDLAIQTNGLANTIRLNTGLSMFVYITDLSDINSAVTMLPTPNWVVDDASGDATKTALNGWNDNQVFVIGMKDVSNPDPSKQSIAAKYKLSFLKSGGSVVVKWVDLTVVDGLVKSVTLPNTDDANPVTWFSFADNGKAVVQPPSINSYDFDFVPYITLLPAGPGKFINYGVNGVLINYNGGVQAYKYNSGAIASEAQATIRFTGLASDSVNAQLFSTAADVVGHDWKYTKFQGSPDYLIDYTKMYFIQDADMHIYKLRFTYYAGKPSGYVNFEYVLL